MRQLPARLGSSLLALSAAATFFAAPAVAQYSTSAAAPTQVWATAMDDVQVKLAPAPEGGQYVSFLSMSGYDVIVTRLDKFGVPVWAGPIIVEDRTLSSTTDYGLASDANGNAYLAFESTNAATGLPAVKVASVNPDSTIRWSRVVSESATAYMASAHVTVASDGYVWVEHIKDKTTIVQRFSPGKGVASFATSITIVEGTFNQLGADIQPSVDGAVIVSCVRYTTFSGAKTLRAHRINADGTRPWAAVGVFVFSTGSVQFGNFPYFQPDGAGGAYFCWYGTSPIQSWIQRIDANGALLYGTNGVSVTSTTTDERVSPTMVIGADGRPCVAWSQHTPSSSVYGVFAQSFDPATGARLWGTNGVAVEPMSTTYSRTWATAGRAGNQLVCMYDDSPSGTQDNYRSAGLNADGTIAWRSDVATNTGSKYRFATANAPDGGCIVGWQGGLSIGASDISIARLASNGSLGPPAASNSADLNGDGFVNAADLAGLLSQWGMSGTADLNGDGTGGAQDLAILLSAWSA